MHEEPDALAVAWSADDCTEQRTLSSILGDCAGDGVVQAPVQYAEVPDTDWGALFHGELGDGLADVAIVMHHL